jgi:hypothetical protein
MANWKKVVVSGSSAELSALTLDTALAPGEGGTGQSFTLSGNEGKVLKVNDGGTAFELGTDSSEFTAAGISGSLGTNATLIRSLTAPGISGSSNALSASAAADIATNVTDIATNATAIGNIGSFTADGISGSLGTNADLIRTLTAPGISGSSANKLPLAGGTMTGDLTMGTNNISGVGNLVVGGDLSVAGTASFTNSTNLAVADKYILLNSGSKGAGGDDSGGIVIQGPTDGVGQLFGFESGSNQRWGLDSNFDADTSAGFSPEAFMSAVLPAGTATTQATIAALNTKYNKNGNIYTSDDSNGNEIWIYA